jgi:hypothetical protein
MSIVLGIVLSACSGNGGGGPALPAECVAQVLGPAPTQNACFGQAAGALKVYDGTAWRTIDRVRYAKDYQDLNAALIDLGSTEAALVIDSAISTDTATVPKTLILIRRGAGRILVNSGQVLTIAGPMIADDTLLFGGTGTVRCASDCLASPVTYRQFGARGDGVSDDKVAIGTAYRFFTGSGGRMYMAPGFYRVDPGSAHCAADFTGLSKIETYGAGDTSQIGFTGTSLGRTFCLSNASQLEFHHFKTVGTQVNAYVGAVQEGEQAAFNAEQLGGANNIKIHHLHAFRNSQMIFLGLGASDFELFEFKCEYVNACIQGAGGGTPAQGRNRIHIHDFVILGDPAGTDDAIAYDAPASDWTIENGVIDKNNTTGHADPTLRANCFWIHNTQGAGRAITNIVIRNITCRNASGVFAGLNNPNKSGVNIAADVSGAVVSGVEITNVTVTLAEYGVYVVGTDPNSVQRVTLNNVSVTDTMFNAFRFEFIQDLAYTNLRASKVAQYTQVSQGMFINQVTNVRGTDMQIDGATAKDGSIGVQFGIGLSGRLDHHRVVGFPLDGFWFPAADITGPFEFVDNDAENNGRYGFNGNNHVTASLGLTWQNNGGTNNSGGLSNGF